MTTGTPATEIIDVEAETLPPSTPAQTPAEVFAEKVKNQLAKFDVNLQEVTLGIKTLDALEVKDTESRAAAYEVTKNANGAKILIEKKRSALVKPLNDVVKAMNDYAKTKLEEPLIAAIKRASDKISAFDREEEKKKLADLKRLADEKRKAEDLEKQKLADLEKEKQTETLRIRQDVIAKRQIEVNALVGIKRVQAQRQLELYAKGLTDQLEADTIQAQTTIQIEASVAKATILNQEETLEEQTVKGARKIWDFEILDIHLVPNEYVTKEVKRKELLELAKTGTADVPGLRFFQKDKLGF